ncbi:MAG: hypothetical protein JW870_17205 [Candidatus Delongbacteria bacterium]|nr:hypothetical protein [Candidatus Delongbacteria bacterium]
MFRYEKDMIPVLKEFFKEKYNQNLSVEELNTGIGIADIVFTKKINKREYYFDNFELLYHTLTLINRRNKKISEIDFVSRFSKKKIKNIIEKFLSMELIEEYNSDYFNVKNRLSPTIDEFYAIEAKLENWKSGFFQALRYKNFAQKSFLALSSEYIHRVDNNLLIKNNIGLISVSLDKTQIIINPKKDNPKDEIAFFYLGEKFTKIVLINNEQEKYCPQQWL